MYISDRIDEKIKKILLIILTLVINFYYYKYFEKNIYNCSKITTLVSLFIIPIMILYSESFTLVLFLVFIFSHHILHFIDTLLEFFLPIMHNKNGVDGVILWGNEGNDEGDTNTTKFFKTYKFLFDYFASI